MRSLIAVVMMLGLNAVACSNACDEATDKLKDECNMDSFAGVKIEESDDCSDDDECSADCFNDASCSEIKKVDADFATDPTAAASSSLFQCIAKCQ